MRYAIGIAVLVAASMACSQTPKQPVAGSPVAPSAAARTGSLLFGNIGGISGLRDADFPPRNDLFTFVTNADAKYQEMGRTPSAFYIDREGVAVWMQEYIRYRVNGCDHGTAVQRVQTQIGGGAAGGVCGSPADGVIAFPSRVDSLAALREFDAAYQRMGRGVSELFIDLEGAAIWIQEYLRYRLNACDAATAQQKVFAQIDGGPVADTCFVSCNYALSPAGVNIGSGSVSSSFELRPTGSFTDPRSCGWTAESDASWLTVTSDYRSGSGFTTVPYSVTRNDGGERTGKIRFSWSGGSANFQVNQSGTPYASSLTLLDSYRSTSDTTECFIRSSSTPCKFTATTNLPGSGYSYAWSVSYFYGTQKSSSVTNSSNTYTVSESCGGTGATSEGASTDVSVTVTITNSDGTSVTLQRTFTMRLFTC